MTEMTPIKTKPMTNNRNITALFMPSVMGESCAPKQTAHAFDIPGISRKINNIA